MIKNSFPFSFTPESSQDVHLETERFLQSEPELEDRLTQLSWIYFSVTNIIPHTYENYWSGHFFPISESWEEFQVSFNLCSQGLYKQAFCSLRSMLETGLLSVYYNINDEGHITVKNWLKSRDSADSNTPTSKKIWEILRSNPEIEKFDSKHRLCDRHKRLGFLHNYVHTKGKKYSNSLGLIKSNRQTFESAVMRKWVAALEEVITLVSTLHILKYPQALVVYDWGSKFGIDIPSMGNLQVHEIDNLKQFLPHDYYLDLELITQESKSVSELMTWIESLPTMTEDNLEEQYLNLQKGFIEMGNGFLDWEEQERRAYSKVLDEGSEEEKAVFERRIEKLRVWAEQNKLMDSSIRNLEMKGKK